jgi:nucleoside-diphosphate-sugar epimerase
VVALRFPFLGDPAERLPWRAEQLARDPGIGVRDLWSYLDYRDGARACLAALDNAPAGCHVVGLAAPVTLSAYPTEYLLDTYLPGVPRLARFAGRAAPFDLSRATDLLRFEPAHLWPIEERTAP